MNPPSPALRLVREDTGESIPFLDRDVADLQAEINRQADVIDGLQRDIRGWATRYANLERDIEEEARKDPLWPDALRLFTLWKRLAKHPRSSWSVERFDLVRPHLKKHGLAVCERAIVGRVFDCYTTKRKNGTTKRHDDWSLIFRDTDHFEESCNRAPLDFVSELEEEDRVAEDLAVADMRAKRQVPSLAG